MENDTIDDVELNKGRIEITATVYDGIYASGPRGEDLQDLTGSVSIILDEEATLNLIKDLTECLIQKKTKTEG